MNTEPNPMQFRTGGAGGGHAIQPAIWPEAGISTESIPYVRLKGAAGMSLARGGIDFAVGGSARFDTYFNLFNLGKWRSLCGELPLELWLRGRGRFHLTVWQAAPERSWERIFGEVVTLDGALNLALAPLAAARPHAVLFFELIALAEGRLEDFAWATTAPPRQHPDMVVAVTTFRREAAAAALAERFRHFRAASDLREHLRMVIVDNGQSVAVEAGDGVTVIPNENLGGAGGFARGLLEARAAGATHCVFTDDDASMHMGALTRTWMLLAYTTDPRTTVAAAMINADYRWQIWENGAIFERGCKPQFFGCDMREAEEVIEMEFASTDPAPPGFYGGWWFFAFPLAQAKHLPFPFFVRGDDVSFSLANDLRIVTLPGVASMQASFVDKASPLTWYLDMRSHLAHHLSLPAHLRTWGQLQRMFLGFYVRNVLRFHYETLSAVNLAIEDVLRGPRFFAESPDLTQRRNDLKALTVAEAWRATDTPPRKRENVPPPRPLRALLLLTLNGHLLPLSGFFGRDLVVEPAHRENFREVYGARRITYVNAERTATYTVRLSHRRFWRESLRMLRNSLKLRSVYRQLQKDWQESYPKLTSEGFWRDRFARVPRERGPS